MVMSDQEFKDNAIPKFRYIPKIANDVPEFTVEMDMSRRFGDWEMGRSSAHKRYAARPSMNKKANLQIREFANLLKFYTDEIFCDRSNRRA
jgi:hypothetical protein